MAVGCVPVLGALRRASQREYAPMSHPYAMSGNSETLLDRAESHVATTATNSLSVTDSAWHIYAVCHPVWLLVSKAPASAIRHRSYHSRIFVVFPSSTSASFLPLY